MERTTSFSAGIAVSAIAFALVGTACGGSLTDVIAQDHVVKVTDGWQGERLSHRAHGQGTFVAEQKGLLLILR